MSEISNLINMDKASLEKLSKSKLINLVLKQQKTVPTPKRPIPTPRKSVKDMVQQYEDNIISPPPEFRDKPIPLARTKKPSKIPIPTPRTIKPLQAPIPAPRTKKTNIKKTSS